MPKPHLKPSEQPPAIGYIRVDEPDEGEIAAHLKTIAACCLREELRLVRTFCDQGYDGSQLARPGIVEMRQTLLDTSGLVVIVPTLDHLSPVDSIRSPLTIMIHRLGGRLLVATEETGTS
jgi:hypothetical protein